MCNSHYDSCNRRDGSSYLSLRIACSGCRLLSRMVSQPTLLQDPVTSIINSSRSVEHVQNGRVSEL